MTGELTAPAARAAGQRSLRVHNLALVLRAVREAPRPPSRADLAASTGLTRATVSALVDQLLAARLAVELPPRPVQQAGRPATPIALAGGTVAALGAEINVDYLGLRAIDLSGTVLTERVERRDLRGVDPRVALERLAELARPVLADLASAGVAVAGTSLALPGLVDSVTGPLRIAPNLGWRDVDVLALASGLDLGGVPALGNEADLAAQAEVAFAPGSSFVYVSGEIGIGGAIVVDGALLSGRHGWGGEIGHVRLDGGHSLEEVAGQDALLAAAGLPRGTPVAELAARADAGDRAAVSALGRAGGALGATLAAVVNVLDVEEVVLGGIYADLAEHLAAPVLAVLREQVLAAPWSDLRVRRASGGPLPAMTGGARRVLDALLADPSAWIAQHT